MMSRPLAERDTRRVADLFAPAPTRIMAVVNVTADSFSEHTHRSIHQAIDWGIELAGQTADVIDVGGESTRPGAARVEVADEMAQVLPVVEALSGCGIAVSVDTVHAQVAQAAITAGAAMVNDVSGGLTDPEILNVLAASQAIYVLQHWRSPFDHGFTHIDVVEEVCDELAQRRDRAVAAGVDPSRIILDPGIGFGKTPDQNWSLIANADRLAALGHPVLWGVSRKRFMAQMYLDPTEPWQRDSAGVAVTALLARQQVWGVRVHTVPDHRAAIAVAEATRTHGGDDESVAIR